MTPARTVLIGSQPQLQPQELRIFVEAHAMQAKLGTVEEPGIPHPGPICQGGFPVNLWVWFESA